MRELKTFQEKIEAYRINAPTKHTQKELADAIHWNKDELSKRLNAWKHPPKHISPLTCAQVQAIVHVLARWGAIQTQEQAKDLLDLMECPDFSPSDWSVYPLSNLRPASGRSSLTQNTPASTSQRGEKLARLRAMQIDRSGILHARLESFVGRQTELIEIEQHIHTVMSTGGYVTITGPAGQGKSSVIAKLVKTYGIEATSYHFIPFNPGPDYQVTLLRHLIAKLIIKHNLPDWYVNSESRPVLYDYFSQILIELAERGKQEIIFIDGLDQLVEDPYGERDLSFLPTNPPKGIVFVLGSRPNETLHPLVLHKPYIIFQLPNLSKHDFSLILAHRGVQLDRFLINQFYEKMGENALYLDLVAKELAQPGQIIPEEIIKRVAENPENIFSLAIIRLKRKPSLWREILKPLLGVLLVAQQPLAVQHMREILKVEDDQLKDGLSHLGGLIINDGREFCFLFHLKLYNYLRQSEHNPKKEYIFATDEEQTYHKKLADWCEMAGNPIMGKNIKHDLMEQEKLTYARYYYTKHLFLSWEWKRLFAILDTQAYGQAKIHDDMGRSIYAQELDLGRTAAAWEGWSLQEGLVLLPSLWRYSLLRCSLASKADTYTESKFEALCLLGRIREAQDTAELLTQTKTKAERLFQIATFLRKQAGQERASLQVLKRYEEVTYSIESEFSRSEALWTLLEVYLQIQLWDRAEAISYMFPDNWRKEAALQELCTALFHLQQWDRAEKVARSIEVYGGRIEALVQLSEALAQNHEWNRFWALLHTMESDWGIGSAMARLGWVHAQTQQWEKAEKAWTSAQTIANSIENAWPRIHVLNELSQALAQAQQWARAKMVAQGIEQSLDRTWTLVRLSEILAQFQQWEQAETLVRSIEDSEIRTQTLMNLGEALAKGRQWKRAEVIAFELKDAWRKTIVLTELGKALALTGQWERAETIVDTLEHAAEKAEVLITLVKALISEQQWDRAQELLEASFQVGSRDNVQSLFRDREVSEAKIWVQMEFGKTLAQAHQLELAQTIASQIKDREARNVVLIEIGKALAQTGLRDRAEAVWTEVVTQTDGLSEIEAQVLAKLSQALAQTQQWEQAETIARAIKDAAYREQALKALNKTLLQAQQWEKAEAIARSIKETAGRITALADLVQALLQAQQWNHAQILARTLEQEGGGTWAIVQLGKSLALAQQWDRAETVAHTMLDGLGKVEVLAELSKSLAQIQQWDRAEALWAEAERLCRTIEQKPTVYQADIFVLLGEALACMQQWDRAEALWAEAERLCRTIEEDFPRVLTLTNLAQAFARLQQWDRVEALSRTLNEEWVYPHALVTLTENLAHAQQWDRAQAIAESIKENQNRAEALSVLCKALAQERQWDRAQAIARALKESGVREKTLEMVGKELIQAQQWKQAEAWAASIEEIWVRVEVLATLGTALTHACRGDQANEIWVQAELLVDFIKEDFARAKALVALARNLADARKHEQALRIVQRSWLQATKKELLINLLPLAYRLFSLKPEIGITLYETFAWVDSVLGS